LKKLCGVTDQSSAGWSKSFNVERNLFNLTYQATEQVINYQEQYKYDSQSSDQNANISTLNYGGLSIWHQLMNRPDFVKAYMALNQVKTIMDNTDVYGRYFAFNAFNVAFDSIEKV
jgi:hypothetical protein